MGCPEGHPIREIPDLGEGEMVESISVERVEQDRSQSTKLLNMIKDFGFNVFERIVLFLSELAIYDNKLEEEYVDDDVRFHEN